MYDMTLNPNRLKLILSIQGERVLGFAHKKFTPEEGVQYLPGEEHFPKQDYTFLGLISLQDPPRLGVKEAIETCHTSGNTKKKKKEKKKKP